MNQEKSAAGVADYILSFKPELKDKIEGADDVDIEFYEDAAERMTHFYFPPDYFDFLRVMGVQTPIAFADDATMNLKEMWDYYATLFNDGEKLFEGFMLIAAKGYNTEQIALECTVIDEINSTKSGKVYHASGGHLSYLLADSFINFLYQNAFGSCAGSHLPAVATYHTEHQEYVLPHISNLLEQFGWERHWFSDSVAICATAPDSEMILWATQSPNRPVWVRVSGRSKKQIFPVGNQVCRVAKLVQEAWWT